MNTILIYEDTLANDIATMPNVISINDYSYSSQSDKKNNKITKAAFVLGTTLSLIQGVSLDISDDARTAQIPVHNNSQVSEKVSTIPESPVVIADLIKIYLKNALKDAKYEVFESGVESSFSRFLNRIVTQYGQKAISTISSSLNERKLSEDVIAETVRSLGSLKHPSTKIDRFKVLLPFLTHNSPIVRDATALAFADIGDKGAISYLRTVAEHERFLAVRESFLSVAEELEEA